MIKENEMKWMIGLSFLALLATGCAGPQPAYRASESVMASRAYQDQPLIETSLFKSDQEVLSEDAIKTILSSRLQLAPNAKLALMKFPGAQGAAFRQYGWAYVRAETYLKSQQEYIDTLTGTLAKSERVKEVILLPSLLTPKDSTIPILREAAVRLQADLLLVFRVTSDIYHQYMLFAKDKVKGYATCEVVLLDVRTGLIPFTSVVTREQIVRKESKDLDLSETMMRAEKEAVLASLQVVAEELTRFLASVP